MNSSYPCELLSLPSIPFIFLLFNIYLNLYYCEFVLEDNLFLRQGVTSDACTGAMLGDIVPIPNELSADDNSWLRW